MSSAVLSDVYKAARTHLNDDEGDSWPDYKLRPKFIQAFKELEVDLVLAGIPIVNAVSVVITVTANTVDGVNVDMSTMANYPTDMLHPVWLKERAVGEMNEDFVDMTEVDFIPNINKSTELIWWSWYQQTIMLLGALNDVQVMLRYKRFLPTPNLKNDSIIVYLAELYLGYRTAALCARSINDGTKADNLDLESAASLDKIIRMSIKELQNLPAKRRPYHRGRGRSRVLRDF